MTGLEHWKYKNTGRDEAAERHSWRLRSEKGERGMSLLNALRRTLEDIERLERVPLTERLAVGSTYALLHKTVASNPEQPAGCFLPLGDPFQPGEALTAQAFLEKVHQTANLLADLGMGSQDVVALLLPDLLEKEVLLWGGQAAGIVCPIPPCLPATQIVDLLQATKAMVLVAPAPSVNHELWQKTEQVRRQVKSITLVLQVRGPGNEREAAYAFNALIGDYPADSLHTGREIALDDLAVILPTRDTTGTPGLVPLTHGNLLYTAWALGLVMPIAPEEVLLSGFSRLFQGWWPAADS
jgi:fatty-acyl-CoA synthase